MSAVSSPNDIWGSAQAEIEFRLLTLKSDNKFIDFPYIKSHFMQNFQILCWIWKLDVNSAKHETVIATKTVIGQYGSSTVLQQVNVQSDHQCKFLGVHTALCVVVEHWQLGRGPKAGEY